MKGYKRGRGFLLEADGVEDDIRAVIITATARLATNPSQVEREQADGWSAVGSFNGFTLPELFVLYKYRRRTA